MARKRSSETELAVSASTSSVPARRKPVTATRNRKKSASPQIEEASVPVAELASVVEAVEVTVVSEPTAEAVAALAYSYWEARGYQGGSPEEDWLRAERELRNRRAATA